MKWFNDNLISYKEKNRINNTIYKICKSYDVKYPDFIIINKRFTATDGSYIEYTDDKNNFILRQIDLAYNHYKIFGMDSLMKVLKHEIAHLICSQRGFGLNHYTVFKDICYDIGGCLGKQFASGKYKKLLYYGIETPWKWEYKCPYCGENFKTKRKLNENNYCAKCFMVKIQDFERIKI